MFRGIQLVPPDTKIPFMAMHKVCFAISTVITVGTILLLIFKGLNLGIDFRGGILLEVRLPQAADLSEMRSTLGGLGLGEDQVGLTRVGARAPFARQVQRQRHAGGRGLLGTFVVVGELQVGVVKGA